MDADDLTVQIWGGPLDGQVYQIRRGTDTVYLWFEVGPPMLDLTTDNFIVQNYEQYALPVKLDCRPVNYPLKAWWDERVRL